MEPTKAMLDQEDARALSYARMIYAQRDSHKVVFEAYCDIRRAMIARGVAMKWGDDAWRELRSNVREEDWRDTHQGAFTFHGLRHHVGTIWVPRRDQDGDARMPIVRLMYLLHEYHHAKQAAHYVAKADKLGDVAAAERLWGEANEKMLMTIEYLARRSVNRQLLAILGGGRLNPGLL